MQVNGSALRAARVSAGLSQQELAVASKTGFGTISKLELGKEQNPRIGTITKIARALGIQATDLLIETTPTTIEEVVA